MATEDENPILDETEEQELAAAEEEAGEDGAVDPERVPRRPNARARVVESTRDRAFPRARARARAAATRAATIFCLFFAGSRR